MNNFQCLKCGCEFHEINFSMSFSNGALIYRNKLGFIKCPECSSMEIDPINNNTDFTNIQYGRYESSNIEDKKKVLRKRAKEHSIKTKDETMYRKAQILKKAYEK